MKPIGPTRSPGLISKLTSSRAFEGEPFLRPSGKLALVNSVRYAGQSRSLREGRVRRKNHSPSAKIVTLMQVPITITGRGGSELVMIRCW